MKNQAPVKQQNISIQPKINFLQVIKFIFISAILFGLGGYFLGKKTINVNQSNNRCQTQTGSQNYVTPVQSPTPVDWVSFDWEYCARFGCSYVGLHQEEFPDISEYIDTNVCKKMSVNWKIIKLNDYGYSIKLPDSFTYEERWGGVEYFPKNDTKNYYLRDDTRLNRDFITNICGFAQTGNISKEASVNKYFYNTENKQHYIIDNTHFIIGKGDDSVGYDIFFNFGGTINDQTKCIIRSIEILK